MITNGVCGLEEIELIIFDGDSFMATLLDHGSFDYLGYLKQVIAPKIKNIPRQQSLRLNLNGLRSRRPRRPNEISKLS